MHTQRVSEKIASTLLLENVRTVKSYVSQVPAIITAVLSKISSRRGQTTVSGHQLFLSCT